MLPISISTLFFPPFQLHFFSEQVVSLQWIHLFIFKLGSVCREFFLAVLFLLSKWKCIDLKLGECNSMYGYLFLCRLSIYSQQYYVEEGKTREKKHWQTKPSGCISSNFNILISQKMMKFSRNYITKQRKPIYGTKLANDDCNGNHLSLLLFYKVANRIYWKERKKNNLFTEHSYYHGTALIHFKCISLALVFL